MLEILLMDTHFKKHFFASVTSSISHGIQSFSTAICKEFFIGKYEPKQDQFTEICNYEMSLCIILRLFSELVILL